MRAIDADELKRRLKTEHCDCEMMTLIDDMPTLTEPVKIGHWIDLDGTPFARCSVCGEKHYGCVTPFCDMCGARMDGEEKSE